MKNQTGTRVHRQRFYEEYGRLPDWHWMVETAEVDDGGITCFVLAESWKQIPQGWIHIFYFFSSLETLLDAFQKGMLTRLGMETRHAMITQISADSRQQSAPRNSKGSLFGSQPGHTQTITLPSSDEGNPWFAMAKHGLKSEVGKRPKLPA